LYRLIRGVLGAGPITIVRVRIRTTCLCRLLLLRLGLRCSAVSSRRYPLGLSHPRQHHHGYAFQLSSNFSATNNRTRRKHLDSPDNMPPKPPHAPPPVDPAEPEGIQAPEEGEDREEAVGQDQAGRWDCTVWPVGQGRPRRGEDACSSPSTGTDTCSLVGGLTRRAIGRRRFRKRSKVKQVGSRKRKSSKGGLRRGEKVPSRGLR
jgi:hypothetical protein